MRIVTALWSAGAALIVIAGMMVVHREGPSDDRSTPDNRQLHDRFGLATSPELAQEGQVDALASSMVASPSPVLPDVSEIAQGPDMPLPSSAAQGAIQETPESMAQGEEIIHDAPITFYSCVGPAGGYCGNTAIGSQVHEGLAACGEAYSLGARVRISGDPTGRVYTCEDRGILGRTQVDVFWYDEADGWAWIAQVGTVADVELVKED